LTERDLAAEFRDGNVRGLARAITLVEQRDPTVRHLLEPLRDRVRRPRAVGVTGAPGTGKSPPVAAPIGLLRKGDQKVAVVAVDPNSPYSGGALLGDRIRLADHFLDPEVFIRSMGTRGHLGGLAEATTGTKVWIDFSSIDKETIVSVSDELNQKGWTVVDASAGGVDWLLRTHRDLLDAEYALNEGGHNWPGGVDTTPRLGTGKLIASVDASTLMWQFFAEHKLAGPVRN